MATKNIVNPRNGGTCCIHTCKHETKNQNKSKQKAAFYVKRNFGDVIKKLSSQ